MGIGNQVSDNQIRALYARAAEDENLQVMSDCDTSLHSMYKDRRTAARDRCAEAIFSHQIAAVARLTTGQAWELYVGSSVRCFCEQHEPKEWKAADTRCWRGTCRCYLDGLVACAEMCTAARAELASLLAEHIAQELKGPGEQP